MTFKKYFLIFVLGKSKQKRKRNYTSSLSHDEDVSELDDAMSVASGISYPSPASTRSVKSTPTRKMPKSTRGSSKCSFHKEAICAQLKQFS